MIDISMEKIKEVFSKNQDMYDLYLNNNKYFMAINSLSHIKTTAHLMFFIKQVCEEEVNE